jgi:hypothetical protein
MLLLPRGVLLVGQLMQFTALFVCLVCHRTCSQLIIELIDHLLIVLVEKLGEKLCHVFVLFHEVLVN